MRNIGIKYYKMGLYTEKQFALFVKRGFVTEDEFKELTGQNYQEVINKKNIFF
ncbi:TPA: XkdX family protein [Staphylococcus pseudintermedius]